MHLHTMRLAAIGPFPGEHEIDLAELGAGGLFLLEGPTGSGKSTLIDAVVFALYGKVASSDATDERLRSTHVGPGTESFVDLVFETGSGIYRVRRSPAHDRPKQRGTGTVRQNVQVKLWRLPTPDAEGELLSTRADEAGAEIARAIGLSREQFVQTVVLPQGEFARFLRARPEERGGLLQRVFGTEVYQRIQAELVEGRKRAERRLTAARDAIGTAVASFAGAADLEPDDAVLLQEQATRPDPDELLAAIRGHLNVIAGERLAAAEVTRGAVAARAAADAAERAAADRAQGAHRRAELERRLATLQGEAEQHAARDATVRTAARAAAIAPHLTATERGAAALESAEAAVGRAFERLGSTGDPAGSPEAIDVPGALARLRDDVVELSHAAELEAGWPQLERELTEARERLAGDEQERLERDAALAGRPQERADLERELSSAHRTAGTVEAAADQVARSRGAREHAVAAEAIAPQLDAARQVAARTAARAGAAAARESALRAARLAGIAGELAAELEPGRPCAVCGGTEHPSPARLDADHVDAETVAAAERDRVAIEAELEAARERGRELETALSAHRTGAGELDRGAAEAAVVAAEEALTVAEQARQDAERLGVALEDFDQATSALRELLAQCVSRIDRAATTIEQLTTRLHDERVAVSAAVAAHTSEEARAADLVDRTRVRIDALEDFRAALEDRVRALGEAERTRHELTVALAAEGFADAAAARDAILDPADLDRLTAQVRQHETELDRVTQGLADPALAAVPADLTAEQADADHELAVKALHEARSAADRAGALEAEVNGTHHRAGAAAAAIEQALAASSALRAELAPVIRMASLADASSGDNAHALTLSTYVLTRRFEEVLAAANQRLAEMSAGRYELRRSEEKEAKGGRRLGLALRVLDHVSELPRDPASLSGGETFYVSLCLALGLADIVTAEAGGVDLGTLFVDEGFGSLDPETLDLVMAELGKLRAGGRAVGVVSHVEAMKSTIADRISVRRRPDGTSTLQVLAGA